MKLLKLKRAISLALSAIMLLPVIGTASVSASESSECTIVSLTDYATASKTLAIYTTDYVKGTDHTNGANIGNYKFDENEKAFSIIKSTSNYMGGVYRFHLKLANGVKIPQAQSWMVVSYKTNATDKVNFTMTSNDGKASVTIASDISVSNDEYVYSAPVNITGTLLDRLNNNSHNAAVIRLPDTTPDSTYFYIKTIAFFDSKAAADSYISSGKLPEDTTAPDSGNAGTTDGTIKGTSSFVGGSYTHEGFTIATSLWVPESYTPDKDYALLIYFHNDGNRGDTPSFTSGNGNAITKNIIEKYGDEFIIFAPRCPSDQAYQWVQQPWTKGFYNYSNTPISKPMSAAISYIYNEIMAKYSIDDTRVYAVGDSMGGGGTWDLMLREPDLLAAAVPVAGYNDPSQAANIRDDLKIWIFHTAQDNVVNVFGDRAMYAILKNMGRDVRYTEYDVSKPEVEALFANAKLYSPGNWQHWAWTPAHNNMEMIDWLVSQRKGTTEKVANNFTDLNESNPYYKAILSLASAGIIKGTNAAATEVSPDGTLTRAQFVTMLGRMLGVDESKYTTSSFTDVKTGQWYSAYVEWAAQNKIVNGTGDGLFSLDNPITVEQAVTILSRLAGRSAENKTGYTVAHFGDKANINSWATEGMEWALSSGVYLGFNTVYGHKLHPSNNATRGLAASMLYNYIEMFG